MLSSSWRIFSPRAGNAPAKEPAYPVHFLRIPQKERFGS